MHLPPRRTGRRVSLASIYRWTGPQGSGGVRLRRFRAMGARGYATTLEELSRFQAALTALGGDEL